MTHSVPFSCCLVGSSALLIRCGNILMERGHDIRFVVARNPDIVNWARNARCPVFSSLNEAIRFPDLDYLFSIANPAVLSPQILALPRRLAVNYHNSPLPRYAGVHATSWAILNGEAHHGVTWHCMSERIDAGDILKQTTFRIGARDTAYDLNRMCHDYGATTFLDLVAELERGEIVRQPQDLSRRSYYSLTAKSKTAGILPWTESADALHKIFRAHTRGPVINDFDLPKILLPNDFVVPLEFEVLNRPSSRPPGTVMNNRLEIATSSQDVCVKLVCDSAGIILDGPELATRYNIHVDSVLPAPTAAILDRLRMILATAKLHEQFCVEQLCRTSPSVPPLQPAATETCCCQLPVPEDLSKGARPIADLLLGATFLWLKQGSGAQRISVACSTENIRARSEGLTTLINISIPLTIEVPEHVSSCEWVDELAARVSELDERGTFGLDLPLRRKLDSLPQQPVTFVFADEAAPTGLLKSQLTIVAGGCRSIVELHSASGPGQAAYSSSGLTRIGNRLIDLARELSSERQTAVSVQAV